ncbi:pyridoxal phosphate-dependent aminotransferase [Hwanghaeella grinnelliae]|nr:pyridoxal phosphate-dependent aminotransferase [Hwanghaeella grinnelliae]
MALKTSKRGEIPAFIVMEVMRAAAEREALGDPVYHLEVGQPGSTAPKGVIQAAKDALDNHRLGYTVALGIPELRAAIADHYAREYGVSVPQDRIVVTTGSSGGFLLSFLAAFDQGDKVALVAPGYPCYRHILTALGIKPVIIETTKEDRYQPSPALLEKAQAEHGKIDGLIVASPSNPTGTMLSKEDMAALAEYCGQSGIRLISDEIYQGISYGRGFETVLSHADHAVVVNSFSKYFSMTGWRLGWLVLPEDLLRPVECLAQNLFISPPTLSQVAAVAAFDCREELESNVARYAANRDLLLRELPQSGFGDLAPSDGAFYLYADVGHMTNDSLSFCSRILKETGAAVTPGLDFDEARGHRTMRFSFSGTTEEIAAAAAALKDWRP